MNEINTVLWWEWVTSIMPVLVFCTQGCPSNVKVENVKAFVET